MDWAVIASNQTRGGLVWFEAILGSGDACGDLRACPKFGLFLHRRDEESSHGPLRGLQKGAAQPPFELCGTKVKGHP